MLELIAAGLLLLLLLVALAVAPIILSAPAVIVTGKNDWSVASGLNVLVPGSLASEPSFVTVHICACVPDKSQ